MWRRVGRRMRSTTILIPNYNTIVNSWRLATSNPRTRRGGGGMGGVATWDCWDWYSGICGICKYLTSSTVLQVPYFKYRTWPSSSSQGYLANPMQWYNWNQETWLQNTLFIDIWTIKYSNLSKNMNVKNSNWSKGECVNSNFGELVWNVVGTWEEHQRLHWVSLQTFITNIKKKNNFEDMKNPRQ